MTGWVAVLRLRLSRPRSSASRVLGWEAISATPAAVVLGAGSFALTAGRSAGCCGRWPNRCTGW